MAWYSNQVRIWLESPMVPMDQLDRELYDLLHSGIASAKFDIVHSFWLGPSWLIGNYLKWKWHVPHITTLMGRIV